MCEEIHYNENISHSCILCGNVFKHGVVETVNLSKIHNLKLSEVSVVV